MADTPLLAPTVDVVILSRPLAGAKTRLSPVLDPDQRIALCRAMLADIIAAARGACAVRSVAVRSADPHVGALAIAAGADWQQEPKPCGLSAAAAAALAEARTRGSRALLLLPADLPLARAQDIDRLAALARPAGVRARDGGTNALLLDPARPFPFAFGPDSFARHAAAATRLGRDIACLVSGGLVEDADTPAALARIRVARPAPNSAAILAALPPLPAARARVA